MHKNVLFSAQIFYKHNNVLSTVGVYKAYELKKCPEKQIFTQRMQV